MQVAAFIALYDPMHDGDYKVTWRHGVDGYIHKALALVADVIPGHAYLVHAQSATLHVDANVAAELRDPDAEIPLSFTFRINAIPNTYKARILVYAGDLETLEKINAAPLPC